MKPGIKENILSGRTPHGLHSPGLLAKSPLTGLALFIVGGLAFGFLAFNMGNNPGLLAWDMAVTHTFRTIQSGAPWSIMESFLFGVFAGRELVVVLAAALGAYFVHKRFWRELAMLVVGLAGGGLLWYFLARYFDIPGPSDHLDVLARSAWSFPSGPAMLAVLFYGLLAYLLIASLPSKFWKWVAGLLMLAAILLVGISSLLFGTHGPSGLIAGYALGLAWAGLAYTLVEKLFKARPQARIVLEGLRSPGWFRQHPFIGLSLFLLGGLVFAGLAYNLTVKGPLLQVDMSVYQALLSRARTASPALNDLMLFGFFLGKQGIQVIALLLSLYFLYYRYWREFAMIQLIPLAGGLLWNFLVGFFSRPRPPEQLGLVIRDLPSFPSGHALGTMITYGLLAYFVIPRMPSRFWKWAVGIAVLAIILFEGFSRIFHANHYLTDVLAGYALGLACLVLVCTLIELIFMKSKAT